MAYIMHKKISGKTYYYAEQRVWKDGKSRREWQKYLGTIDRIIEAVEGNHLAPDHAVLFELGGVASYLSLAKDIQLVEKIDCMLPKRKARAPVTFCVITLNRPVRTVFLCCG